MYVHTRQRQTDRRNIQMYITRIFINRSICNRLLQRAAVPLAVVFSRINLQARKAANVSDTGRVDNNRVDFAIHRYLFIYKRIKADLSLWTNQNSRSRRQKRRVCRSNHPMKDSGAIMSATTSCILPCPFSTPQRGFNQSDLSVYVCLRSPR